MALRAPAASSRRGPSPCRASRRTENTGRGGELPIRRSGPGSPTGSSTGQPGAAARACSSTLRPAAAARARGVSACGGGRSTENCGVTAGKKNTRHRVRGGMKSHDTAVADDVGEEEEDVLAIPDVRERQHRWVTSLSKPLDPFAAKSMFSSSYEIRPALASRPPPGGPRLHSTRQEAAFR